MKLREFIKGLNDLTEKNPEALDYDVVTSSDDEGNGFNLIGYHPSLGWFDIGDGTFDEHEESNAVCVN